MHALRGKEAISDAWHFDVTVSGAASEAVEHLALGQRATLTLDLGDHTRAFYGVVASVRVDEAHAIDRETKYVVRVVPRLWLLRRNRRTRIFQNRRIPDIVDAVLRETNIVVRWALVRGYPTREYCTQYEESDFDFIRRILAEAGIYFYFFSGEEVPASALDVDTATGYAAQVGAAAVGFGLGAQAGGLAGSAIQMAETLIPGDTIVCADDALCYPPVAGDDPAALAASTVASLSASTVSAIAGDSGGASAAAGTASAAATAVLAAAGGGGALPMHYMANQVSAVTTYDKITSFTLQNSVRPKGAMLRDYDPERPLVRLQSVAVSTAPFPPSPMDIAAIASAAAENAVSAVSVAVTETASDPAKTAPVAEKVVDVTTTIANLARPNAEIYEHHNPFLFPKWAFASDAAPRILRQARRRASIGRGASGCYDFSPGHVFDLGGHLPTVDGKYVITKVRHAGQENPGGSADARHVYENSFECAPANMTYPPRPIPRRSVQVALTATVVGPKGAEIHVDAKGQIKVEFHWDRAGSHDDTSSCWIRAMQPWGGAGWGHQFIPRVGMEVVVVFEGGDPDKPIVLGCLYNQTHPPSFFLPDQKTKSGIRTQSTPGGKGFNELSFDDAAGAELIHVHAQRDLTEVVERDHETHVRANQAVGVSLDQSLLVGHDRTLKVGNDLLEHIGHDHRASVFGHSSLDVAGARGVTVRGEDTLTVNGNRSVGVDGTLSIQVGEQHRIMAGDPSQPGQINHFSWGSLVLGARERLVLSAQGGLVFQCGGNRVEMDEDGVRIRANSVSVRADERVAVGANGPDVILDESFQLASKTIKLVSEKASLVLEKEARLDGTQVKLNCKGIEADTQGVSSAAVVTQKLHLVFSDSEGKAYANKDYVLIADGRMFEGTTKSDGSLEEEIPDEATEADILLFLENRPHGPKRRYTVKVGEIPAVDTVRGALMRLRNLGYYHGPIVDELERLGIEAIERFQKDHGQPVTGALDGGTRAALSDRHLH